MKKLILFLLVLLLISLSLVFTACKQTEQQIEQPPSVPTEENTEEQESPKEDEKQTCIVTFDSDTGEEVVKIEIKKGEKLTEPTEPTKTTKTTEYKFIGWFNQSSKWDFETGIVTEDITLIAHWEVEASYTEPVLPKN